VNLNNLSKDELIKLCEMQAKNWLAHDGCWFLAVEESDGQAKAIEFDKKSWERFTVVEAKRIMEAFDIPEGGGLKALEKALEYRLYATINKQSSEWKDGKLIFTMTDCRVQSARRRKKLADFPCKEVGLVEYEGFAKTIDPKIKTKCICCPPDDCGETYCQWEFSV